MRVGDSRDVGRRTRRLAVDGDDGVARLEPRERSRLARHHVAHDRRAQVELQAERGEKISFPVAFVQSRERKRPLGAHSAWALDRDLDSVVARGVQELPPEVLPRAYRRAVDCGDDIARGKPCCRCGRRIRRRGEHRALSGNAREIRACKEQHREQQVSQRSGSDDGAALPDVLAIECASAVIRRDLALALIDHLDVTAEGHRGDRPLGRIGPDASRPYDAAEADGEAQHLDPGESGHEVMAELVECDQ